MRVRFACEVFVDKPRTNAIAQIFCPRAKQTNKMVSTLLSVLIFLRHDLGTSTGSYRLHTTLVAKTND
jgi:hypothetical protein